MSDKRVFVADIECGNPQKPFLISGPCVVEDRDIMFKTAEKLKQISERLNIPIIFKSSFTKDNRSDLKYYHGPGLEAGLNILKEIKEQFGLPILSDIHESYQAKLAGEILDVIQIPAYLCMQSSLVTAAAKTGKVVNLKHGQFLSPSNMDKPVKKVVDSGNTNIILTERGYAFGYNDLIVDPRSFYDLSQTGYPVVFDITHSIRKYGIPSASKEGGLRQYTTVLAHAAAGAGVEGYFIEAHPNPELALCDAASQYCVNDLEEFLKPLLDIHFTKAKYK
jgi:2-dehydro-3-deoxyphosphooctonate aldolase (KDO 8-P synthase)